MRAGNVHTWECLFVHKGSLSWTGGVPTLTWIEMGTYLGLTWGRGTYLGLARGVSTSQPIRGYQTDGGGVPTLVRVGTTHCPKVGTPPDWGKYPLPPSKVATPHPPNVQGSSTFYAAGWYASSVHAARLSYFQCYCSLNKFETKKDLPRISGETPRLYLSFATNIHVTSTS